MLQTGFNTLTVVAFHLKRNRYSHYVLENKIILHPLQLLQRFLDYLSTIGLNFMCVTYVYLFYELLILRIHISLRQIILNRRENIYLDIHIP